MKKTILTLSILIGVSVASFGQTNLFPLYSNGAWSGGGGDFTGITNPQLKLQSNGLSTSYVRAVHLSNHSTVSTVFNFQTGKDVYWGEPSDNGKYIFRGRDMVVLDGKTGIGTAYPTHKLDVVGNMAIYNNDLYLRTGIDINHGLGWYGPGKPFAGTTPDGPVVYGWSGGVLGTTNGGQQTVLSWNSNGEVAIATTKTNGYKLSVGGKMRAEEIEVSLASTWPDYVFKEDYELKPLTEVEKYIKENAHLPNVPSDKEVSEKGINLGEMDAILLRKIEELTLYVIELEKKIAEKE